jgi:mono/diheme cytochrome c family protein
MKHISMLVILVTAPLLMAAIYMDDQQSYKPYKAPVLSAPVGAVPVTGREIISQESELRNPKTPTAASLSRGKTLFETNCAMCHGETSAERGPVGKKLVPPPPGLDHDMAKGLSDAVIFKAITLGFGRMPPFKDKLTTDERWSLVNFLRTRK